VLQRAPRVAHRGRGDTRPDGLTVAAPIRLLDDVVIALAGDHLREDADILGRGVRIAQVEEAHASQLSATVAEHALVGRVALDDEAVPITRGDTDRGELEDRPKPGVVVGRWFRRRSGAGTGGGSHAGRGRSEMLGAPSP